MHYAAMIRNMAVITGELPSQLHLDALLFFGWQLGVSLAMHKLTWTVLGYTFEVDEPAPVLFWGLLLVELLVA